MRGATLDLHVPADGPLVRIDHGHAGRLADNGEARTRQARAEFAEHRPDADAADLLVI